MRASTVAWASAGVIVCSCGPVHSTMLRKDYAEADARQTVRLVLVTSPLPAGKQAVGQLWSEVGRHYANDHRDFIVKTAVAGPTEPTDLCGNGIEGILHLQPTAKAIGLGVEESVDASLTRCRDGALVWSAEAAGSWSSYDPNLKDVIEHYVTELGEEVRPYVAPAYHLLKATFDTLPLPVLDDKGKDEKIDLTD
jgi:probable lipoprotein (TIGR04455 family)